MYVIDVFGMFGRKDLGCDIWWKFDLCNIFKLLKLIINYFLKKFNFLKYNTDINNGIKKFLFMKEFSRKLAKELAIKPENIKVFNVE